MRTEISTEQEDQLRHDRTAYAKKFHKLLGTEKALKKYLTPADFSELKRVEGVEKYLVQHGLNGGDNRNGTDEAYEYIWVSGYLLKLKHTSERQNDETLFVGLAQGDHSDYLFGSKFPKGLMFGAVKVEGHSYKSSDAALAAMKLGETSDFNSLDGPFPVFGFSEQQLTSERFMSDARQQLARGLESTLAGWRKTAINL